MSIYCNSGMGKMAGCCDYHITEYENICPVCVEHMKMIDQYFAALDTVVPAQKQWEHVKACISLMAYKIKG